MKEKNEQSGKEAASWIPILNDKRSNWHSRRTSSLIGVMRKGFRREVRPPCAGCDRFAAEDKGREPISMIVGQSNLVVGMNR